MIVSFILQAIALHFGRLSQVQPILTLELVFLVIVLSVWFGFSVGRREWLGSLAAVGGLAGFLYCAHPEEGNLSPSFWSWVIAGRSLQRRHRGRRHAGACGALGGGGRPCSARRRPSASPSPPPAPRWSPTSPPRTGSRSTGTVRPMPSSSSAILAVFLTQNAFHAGPIVASQSTLVMVDPLASILIGVGLFGDDLRTGGAWGPLEAFSLLVMFVGAFSLAHSPLVSGMKGDDEQYHELLSQRAHAEKVAANACPPPLTHPETLSQSHARSERPRRTASFPFKLANSMGT